MIHTLIVYRDRKQGCYTLPGDYRGVIENCAEDIQRAILADYKKFPAAMADCELYYIGTYDDHTCKFDLLKDPLFLLDVGEIYKAAQTADLAKQEAEKHAEQKAI